MMTEHVIPDRLSTLLGRPLSSCYVESFRANDHESGSEMLGLRFQAREDKDEVLIKVNAAANGFDILLNPDPPPDMGDHGCIELLPMDWLHVRRPDTVFVAGAKERVGGYRGSLFISNSDGSEFEIISEGDRLIVVRNN